MTRRTMLATFSTVAVAGYLLLLLRALLWVGAPAERRLDAPTGSGPHVHLYLELVGVDVVRDAMQVRLSLEPDGLAMDAASSLPDRDLVLVATHDKRGERIEVHAHQPAPTTPIELDLYDGDVSGYPLDTYRAGLTLRCLDGSTPDARATPLPWDVTVWERVLGFRLRTTREPGVVAGGDRLVLRIRRSPASRFFVLCAYGAMVVLACIATTIGGLAFLRVRRPEASLMGILGALVFALPALRNALPGGVPLGVSADLFVYLWAEFAVISALVLVVAAWARGGAAPD